jgi:hypothetical protein
MKMNGKHEVLTHISRRGLLLAALLAMVLSDVGITRAQLSGPSGSALAKDPAGVNLTASRAPNALVAKPSEAPANAPATSEEKPSAKGTQEGIKVHGHWVIEVRNPDGSVDKHVEFENQMCPDEPYTRAPGSVTTPNPAIFPGGATFLSSLANGQASSGTWTITLGSSAELNTTGGPQGCILPQNLFTTFTRINIPSDILTVFQSNGSGPTSAVCLPSRNCFTTLAPPAAGPNITLNGQFTAPQSGTIAVVSTANFWCPDGGASSPSACLAQGSVPAVVTGTPLPSPGVSYSLNQTIAVNVQISFQ